MGATYIYRKCNLGEIPRLSPRMCAFPRPIRSHLETSNPVHIPQPQQTPTRPAHLPSRPGFLSGRARNARGVMIGGAALAGGAMIAGAALAVAALASARRASRNRLRGKVVVITGSSRGLGLALAEEFARRGARVVLTARDQAELDRARAQLFERGLVASPHHVLTVQADLRKQEEAEYLIHRVTEAWGQIDVLVNNAGVITVGPIENQTIQDFQEVMDSNFFSGLHCTLTALPQMLARRAGSIVNITSIGGKVAVPHLLPYTASKFAAVGFSEGLHAELRGKGVHVLTVCPGLMRTGSHLNALFSGKAEEEYRWFSLGATLPGISTSARHAARKIVQAVLARKTEIAITPQAILAARLADVSPELTSLASSLVNRVLRPSPAEKTQAPVKGSRVRALEPKAATWIGGNAARRYNESSV